MDGRDSGHSGGKEYAGRAVGALAATKDARAMCTKPSVRVLHISSKSSYTMLPIVAILFLLRINPFI